MWQKPKQCDTVINSKSPKYPLIKDKYEDAIKEYNRWWKLVIDDKKEDTVNK